jgi:putative transposase
MIQSNPFKWFKTSPELIRLAVMLYVRFPPFCDIRCCLAKGIDGLIPLENSRLIEGAC